jgi:prepilin-type N-terminal cleavage/methylation domain-containing protein
MKRFEEQNDFGMRNAECGIRNLECGMRSADFGVWDNKLKFRIPKSEFRNSKGVTFIEMLAVMAIIGILAAVVIPRLNPTSTTSKASVDGAANMVASDIRYAQEFAMANRVLKTVTFNAGSSVYTFSSNPVSPSDNMDPSGRLPSGVTISNNFTVTFNSLGEPTTGGGGSVAVSDGVQTKTISVVNYTGKVI